MPSPTEFKRKTQDLGAGLRISKQSVDEHPAGPPRHGELSQAERAFTLASTFMSGVLAISASQFLGAPLKLVDPIFYEGYMAYTKECFAILITCLTQWWAPTVVRVSGDTSMLGQLTKKPDGGLQCKFADRMVLMANHQLYTDWLYLWWIAYTNGMHGFIYIILKESLKNIPIIGWGCQFYNFIFLSRKWEQDKSTFKQHLAKLKNNNPMWLIIFPEGTNLSASTREKSKAWAEKNGLKDMKHQLLPRSTGLRFCLQELRDSTEWLYDCTIAYEGVPEGQFGQDIFTLRSSFFEGRPPKSVNMHWRRFRIDDIPVGNSKAFEVWLRNRWREKDYMLEYFSRNNRFPADDFWKEHLADVDTKSESSGKGKSLRSVAKPAVIIETEVKSGNWNEFVKIFAPITSVMMALMVAYGASPNDLPFPGGKEFVEQHMKSLLSGGEMKGLPSPDELEKMITAAAKMGIGMGDAVPKQKGTVEDKKRQELTQANLAKLVKETAIQNGMVLPGGMRRVNTALPGVAASRRPGAVAAKPGVGKAKSMGNLPATKAGLKTKPTAPAAVNTAPKLTGPKSMAQPQQKAQPKAIPKGEMQSVMTKSGVMIKIPKAEVEKTKRTGTVITKDGLVIKVGKDEVEEAQKKKGEIIMTAGGVPIKVAPSGALVVEKKGTAPASGAGAGTAKSKRVAAAPSVAKTTPAAKKPVRKASISKPPPGPIRTGAQSKGPQVVTKKDFVAKKPAVSQAKGQTASSNSVVKKAGT